MAAKRKILFAVLTFILILSLQTGSFGADTQDLTADHVTRVQNEISADISRLRVLVEKELEGFTLASADLSRRIDELTSMSESASSDLTAWGYTNEQKQTYSQLLMEMITTYSSYIAIIQGQTIPHTTSIDISTLQNIQSPDINTSDNLRQEISRVSRTIDVQVFYLQSKISKLKLELEEAAVLKKQLKAAQEGEGAIERPRLHILALENARINAALTRLQVLEQRRIFDADVNTIQRLRRQLADIQDKLLFTPEMLVSNIDALNTRLKAINAEMGDARKALDSANSALRRVRNSLTSADLTGKLTHNSSMFMYRRSRVTYWEYMINMLNDEANFVREIQNVWQKRYDLFHNQAAGNEIWNMRDDAQTRIAELQRQLDSVRSMEASTIRDINSAESQSEAENVPAEIKQTIIRIINNRRKVISDIVDRYETVIPQAVFYQRRLYNEANDNLTTLRLAEKVSSFSKETVMNFLNTELWNGEGYSVTVSKLITAVLVFLSSFFLSSLGSNWIKRRMLKREKTSVTAINAIQRITFYILWVTFALIALNIVKIPLTAFAFMGGAIALGIGFGMQNIFNNFISGFIVIFSRPFKVNDIVDVAGTQGTVQDIGSRSTTVKTWDGFDVIIPNRYFLENNVTNWTKSDPKKRDMIAVGVSYDSDSREVEKLLMDIVKEHSKVLKDPAPYVIFKNFGNDALEFEVYYWIDLRTSSGPKVASDMRHHIAAVFNREGINIPYPQRDIHIIPAKPESESESESKSEKKS
ncbi:MAG: mechanosensitive ion channel [Synergistaceae bacterium]|nr:mechanosensitive ion channel [Synergistaceae bacterium]